MDSDAAPQECEYHSSAKERCLLFCVRRYVTNGTDHSYETSRRQLADDMLLREYGEISFGSWGNPDAVLIPLSSLILLR